MKYFEDIIKEKLENFEYPYEEGAWKQFRKRQLFKKIYYSSFIFSTIIAIVALYYFINSYNSESKLTSSQNNVLLQEPQQTLNIQNNITTLDLDNNKSIKIKDEKKSVNNNFENTGKANESIINTDNNLNNNINNDFNNIAVQNVGDLKDVSIKLSAYYGCVPLKVEFEILNLPATAKCLWNFGDGNISTEKNPSYIYKKPGNYKISLTIKNNDLEKNFDNISAIEVYPKPFAKFTYQQNANNILFENKSKQFSSIKWILSDTVIYNETFAFEIKRNEFLDVMLIAENQYKCTDTIRRKIELIYLMPVQLADAFTPDGDGVNDLFGPQVLDYDSYNFIMYIYTKTGKCIFEGKGSPIWWDGTDKETKQPCPADNYFYKIFAIDRLGNRQEFSGKIKLLR